MPKYKLQFQIPEEEVEFNAAVNGIRYASALEDIRNAIRSKLKHGVLTKDEETAWQEISQIFNEATEGLSV